MNQKKLLDNIRNKLKKCCEGEISFICDSCGNEKLVQWTCGHRCCDVCRKKRRYRLKKRMSPLFNQIKNPMMLTLTLKGHHKLSKDVKDRLYKNAREFFRRTRLSGIRVLEIVPKTDGYYYHLHCIIETNWHRLPYGIVKHYSKVWRSVTHGESFWIHIDPISNKDALWYVLKYAVKPMKKLGLNEYVKFFYKTRMLSKFGRFYNLKVEKVKTNFLDCDCGSVLCYFTTRWSWKIEHGIENYAKEPPDIQCSIDKYIN